MIAKEAQIWMVNDRDDSFLGEDKATLLCIQEDNFPIQIPTNEVS